MVDPVVDRRSADQKLVDAFNTADVVAVLVGERAALVVRVDATTAPQWQLRRCLGRTGTPPTAWMDMRAPGMSGVPCQRKRNVKKASSGALYSSSHACASALREPPSSVNGASSGYPRASS